MENIKAVIFDFDNTLADRTDASYETYIQFMDEFAPQFQKGSIEYESVLQDMMIWDMFGNFNKDFLADNLEKKYGIKIDFNMMQWWGENQYKHEDLFPDTVETLLYLREKGYKLGVITNGNGVFQRSKVEKVGLGKYMDYMLIAGEYNLRKPDKICFDFACEKLGVKNEEAVYVGDIFSNDVLGAYRAGLTPIWLWPDGRRRNIANVIQIQKISELKNYL